MQEVSDWAPSTLQPAPGPFPAWTGVPCSTVQVHRCRELAPVLAQADLMFTAALGGRCSDAPIGDEHTETERGLIAPYGPTASERQVWDSEQGSADPASIVYR